MNKTQKTLGGLALVITIGVALRFFVFGDDFLFAGTLEATKVDLASQLNSSIACVCAQEGDKVVPDQELVNLACEDYRVNARLANHNYERNQKLFRKGAISQDTLDQFINKKEDADIHLMWCSIKSPIFGTVLSRYHEPGEYVSPGSKILTLANIREIWAYIYVPQPEVAKLKVGMPLIGIVPELNNKKFNGQIVKVNSEAEFTPKNVQTRSERTRLVFGIKISFLGSNEDEVLKPGMTIEVKLPKD